MGCQTIPIHANPPPQEGDRVVELLQLFVQVKGHYVYILLNFALWTSVIPNQDINVNIWQKQERNFSLLNFEIMHSHPRLQVLVKGTLVLKNKG